MAKRDSRAKMHYIPIGGDRQACKSQTWSQWTTDELGKVDCRGCLTARRRALRERRHVAAQPERRNIDRELAALADRMCALGIEVSDDPKGGA